MDNVEEYLLKKQDLLAKKEHKKLKHLEDIFHHKKSGTYLEDIIFGSIDGVITTFAVVAGAFGATFPLKVAFILGLANVFADGISIAVGDFLAIRAEKDYQKGQRIKEEWEIDNLKPIQEYELTEIYRKKGFKGEDLKKIVNTIMSDKKIWVDEMMKDELNISENSLGNPAKHGFMTFISFVVSGIIPLIPFILQLPLKETILMSMSFTAITLFVTGALKSLVLPLNWFKSGIEMLLVGSIAATIAYFVGDVIKQLII